MTETGAADPRRILLATRLTEDARVVAGVAERLAHAVGGPLTVLYVAVEADTAPLVAATTDLDEDAVEERILADLATDARQAARAWFGDRDVDVRVGHGPVVETIAEHAHRHDVGFLVVGHHERGPLARLVGADPAHDLLDRVDCPVVVVPIG